MKTTQYSACVMRDTPGRQSEAPSGGGVKTELTLSTLIRVDRPYQDTLADGMADVAENSERVQKHVWDCERVMVMQTFDCRLLLSRCVQKCLPVDSVSVMVRGRRGQSLGQLDRLA
jgi:hypothetical protein